MVGETQFQQQNHGLALQEEFGDFKIEQRESREQSHTKELLENIPTPCAGNLGSSSAWSALLRPTVMQSLSMNGLCFPVSSNLIREKSQPYGNSKSRQNNVCVFGSGVLKYFPTALIFNSSIRPA